MVKKTSKPSKVFQSPLSSTFLPSFGKFISVWKNLFFEPFGLKFSLNDVVIAAEAAVAAVYNNFQYKIVDCKTVWSPHPPKKIQQQQHQGNEGLFI